VASSSRTSVGRVVTVDVLLSQLRRPVPEIRAWGQWAKVDQKLRAASVKSQWAVVLAVGHFITPYTAVTLRSTYCGLMGPRIVSTVRYGGVRHIRLPQKPKGCLSGGAVLGPS
jgi:hypothetical protein